MEKRRELEMHISECRGGIYCRGFLGDYDTYVCICWCHEKKKGTP